ncbi:WxL domain-containing protein [Companilactobacillus baiquanensis]|uniref:WxL domain-containing protein n=1 Tax=Companilactobacillus baiquanensis TaxID=2486005 RepID=A0ABW1UV13_9LACO|nr:WxL domain-containing protein [Companilactobacillus baiquanensis]
MMKMLKGITALCAVALATTGSLITVKAATTPTTLTATTPTSPAPTTKSSDIALQQTGNLMLDSAPDISFGTQNLDVSKTTYTNSTFDSTLHVTNPGFPSGWAVTLSDTPFTSTGSTTSTTLKGAALSLTDPTLTADDSTNQSTPPTANASVDVSSSAALVADAGLGDGIGAYTGTYASGDASLYVPAGNIGGSYTSTLTWTLSDAPA